MLRCSQVTLQYIHKQHLIDIMFAVAAMSSCCWHPLAPYYKEKLKRRASHMCRILIGWYEHSCPFCACACLIVLPNASMHIDWASPKNHICSDNDRLWRIEPDWILSGNKKCPIVSTIEPSNFRRHGLHAVGGFCHLQLFNLNQLPQRSTGQPSRFWWVDYTLPLHQTTGVLEPRTA